MDTQTDMTKLVRASFRWESAKSEPG